MIKRLVGIVVWICIAQLAIGQKYFSKTGRVTFSSKAPLENIESNNSNAFVVVDASTAAMEWGVLIKSFQFEKALMQEHFNENYLESHKFPKAIFKGMITNMQDINWKKDGTYTVHSKGDLTIHGVTKPFTATGQVVVKQGKISVSSSFAVTVADFNIEVPKVVRDNIAKTVDVKVSADLQAMN
jgi:polyisoprenoid-binding protein YceI